MERKFLGWDRPVLDLAAERLLRGITARPADLSSIAIMAPTRNAGRRLRERLALLAEEKGLGGVLSPLIRPPEYFLNLGISEEQRPRLASRNQTVLAWARTLRKAKLGNFRAVFPVDPPEQDFRWALQVGREFADLRETLGEAGKDLKAIFQAGGDEMPERERWEALARLETAYLETLDGLGLEDRQDARARSAEKARLPEEIQRLILLATPDPIPLALRVARGLSRKLPVEIWVHAPESVADGFDEWGQPEADFWESFLLPLKERQLHVCTNAEAQARLTARWIAPLNQRDRYVAVGAPDREAALTLRRVLEERQVPVFDPEGEALKTQGFHYLLRTLGRFVRTGEFADFAELVRCPGFVRLVESRTGENISTRRLLEALDRFQSETIPRHLSSVRTLLKRDPENEDRGRMALEQAMEVGLRVREELSAEGNLTALLGAMVAIHGGASLDPEKMEDQAVIEGGKALESACREWEAVSASGLVDASPLDALDFVVEQAGEQRIYETGHRPAVEMLGWLELLWEDASWLVLTGMNDGVVPDAVVGDKFIPEALRGAPYVGLKTNRDRFARDAYLLAALLGSRAKAGRVDVLLGKETDAGDPLRPSRLLYLCRDEELPKRIETLFKEPSDAPEMGFWNAPWKLKIPEAPPLNGLRVTEFRTYLACPFRYYLTYRLRMESLDLVRTEMGSREFGIVCHEVWERFGRDAALRDSTNADDIGEFFTQTADAVAGERFGGELSVPLQLQLESLKQRFRRAAEIQAEQRRNGWRIVDVERVIHESLPWKIGGLPIWGKVDRIEQHEDGAWRFLDYKTSDRAANPKNQHLTKIMGSTNLRQVLSCARFKMGKAEYRWQDLQMVLYAAALQEIHGEPVACGYFNVPKALEEIGVVEWKDLDADLVSEGVACAERIVAAIQENQFWPPTERPPYDDYGPLLFDVPEMTVEAGGFALAERLEDADA